MFCLYSPCSPSAYLPLQRPMPLWAAPTAAPPIASGGVPLQGPGPGPGMPHGQADPSEDRRVGTRGGKEGGPPSHCRGKDGDGLPVQDGGGGRPFFFLRGAGLPGKRRRTDSSGRSVIISPPAHPSPGLPFNGKYPSIDVDSPFHEKSSVFESSRWEETSTSPGRPSSRSHSGSKDPRMIIEEQRDEEEAEVEEEEEGGVGDIEEEEEDARKLVASTDRNAIANRIIPDVRPSSETPTVVVMAAVANGNKWPITTPPFDSSRRRSDYSSIHRSRTHHVLPLSPVATPVTTDASSQSLVPSPTTTIASKPGGAVLKFGIDSILRSKDTHGVSSDKVVQHHHPPTHHHHQQQQHHQSHHHPLGPPPPPPPPQPSRSHPPLLNIPSSKALVGNHGPIIGSNFILTSHAAAAAAVYSPHLFALQGQLHYSHPHHPHPHHHQHPPSSSSSSSSPSSAAASPASVHHLRPIGLPPHPHPHPHPTLHYSLHHPFHITSRHSDFPGSTFGLLGSAPDLHSPHLLHPHSKKKRSWSRAVFSNLQRKGLEKRFEVQKYVTKPDRRQLAAMLGLTDAQVKVWFQNRRMKWRHQEEAMKKKETDPRKPAPPPPPPSQQPPAPHPHHPQASRRSPAAVADDSIHELAAIDLDRSTNRLLHRPPPQNHSAMQSDDENSLLDVSSANALLSSRDRIDGRIRVGDAADDAVGNRSNGIMSVADILDLRKESVTCTPTSNDVGDKDDGDDDDDDEISVISASI